MAVLTTSKPAGSHWYDANGNPCHSQPKADGTGERITTLRDARRLGLFPSVTTILSVMAKPGLDNWKMDQVALAALANPKSENESDEYWCKRVKEAAFAQVEQAADLGTRIHAALENAMQGLPYPEELGTYIDPVMEWRKPLALEIIEREKCLVNDRHGFAGTADVLFRYGTFGIGILDYKTRKTKPGEKAKPYDGQAMQLAAYAATYFGEESICRVLAANIYISTTEPGRVDVVKHEDMEHHWEAFKYACSLWRYLKGYDPRCS